MVNRKVTGVIELQDIIKPGIQERFERLRKMGVKTVMVTGDNPLTAKSSLMIPVCASIHWCYRLPGPGCVFCGRHGNSVWRYHRVVAGVPGRQSPMCH